MSAAGILRRFQATSQSRGEPIASPEFGQAAVFQSGVCLPESEVPGISPARGLGRSIHTSPLSTSLRTASRHQPSHVQVEPSQTFSGNRMDGIERAVKACVPAQSIVAFLTNPTRNVREWAEHTGFQLNLLPDYQVVGTQPWGSPSSAQASGSRASFNSIMRRHVPG